MRWSVIRPKILEVFRDVMGLDVYWRDRERPFVDPDDGCIALLHTIATGSVGGDEFRQEYNSTSQKIDLTQAGIRTFTVSVLVESYDQGDETQALEYVERLRDALERSQILELFRAINLTVREIGTPNDLSGVEDDHAVSAASVDVFFAYGNNVTSAPGLAPLDWIETVETEADIEG